MNAALPSRATLSAMLRDNAHMLRAQADDTLDPYEASELETLADRCDAQADSIEAAQAPAQRFPHGTGILITLAVGIAFWLALTALFAVHYYG